MADSYFFNRLLLISAFLLLAKEGNGAFVIPLPFGNISIEKGQSGETKIGLQNGLNIMGHGAQSGLNFTIDKNGTFTTKSKGGILTGGQEFGTNSTFGVDKSKGLTADTDLNLGNNTTVQGGLGKENTFINQLIEAIKKKQQEQRGQKFPR